MIGRPGHPACLSLAPGVSLGSGKVTPPALGCRRPASQARLEAWALAPCPSVCLAGQRLASSILPECGLNRGSEGQQGAVPPAHKADTELVGRTGRAQNKDTSSEGGQGRQPAWEWGSELPWGPGPVEAFRVGSADLNGGGTCRKPCCAASLLHPLERFPGPHPNPGLPSPPSPSQTALLQLPCGSLGALQETGWLDEYCLH